MCQIHEGAVINATQGYTRHPFRVKAHVARTPIALQPNLPIYMPTSPEIRPNGIKHTNGLSLRDSSFAESHPRCPTT